MTVEQMNQEEGIVVPGEGQGGSLTPVEEQARKGGWKPQEEYSGDPDAWIPAKEFVGRQRLYDRIKSLENKITYQQGKFEKDMGIMSDHFAKMQKVEFDKAMRQLKAQKELALQDGDVRTLDAVNEEIRETEKAHEAAKQAPRQNDNVQIAAEFNEWRTRNTWFDQDTSLKKEAEAIGIGYAASNPGITHAQVLQYVEEKIKQYYPDKFETKRKQVVEQIVEAGGITPQSGTSSRKAKGLTEADLSEQEKVVMTTLIKRGALKELAAKNKVSERQQYLNDLATAKGLK